MAQPDNSKRLLALKNKVVGKLFPHDRHSNAKTPFDIISNIFGLDPTENKKYSDWLVRRYIAGDFMLEDTIIRDDLLTYDSIKSKLPISDRDIGNKTYQEFISLIKPYKNSEAGTYSLERLDDIKKAEDLGSIEVLSYTDSDNYVKKINTEEASILLAKGVTRWCTANGKDGTAFDEYNNQGPLLVIKHNGNLYQLHIDSYQLMDSDDIAVPDILMDEIFKIPYIAKYISDYESDILDSDSAIYEYCNNMKGRWALAEEYISSSFYSLAYCEHIANRHRIHSLEKNITDPDDITRYAENIIRGRFEDMEDIIFSNKPKVAFDYMVSIHRHIGRNSILEEKLKNIDTYGKYLSQYLEFDFRTSNTPY